MHDFLNDPRFKGIVPFEKKVWLSSPTMHGDEQRWVDEAIQMIEEFGDAIFTSIKLETFDTRS